MIDKALTARTRILKVEIESDDSLIDGDDGLIVTFSDGTTAGYVVEELLLLRPHRELTHEPNEQNLLQMKQRDQDNGQLLMEAVPLEVPKNGNGRGH